MQKKVLSEIGLYNGFVDMPKGFEIDLNKLNEDTLQLQINNKEFPFSKEWDKLNTYLREHVHVKYNFQLIKPHGEMFINLKKPLRLLLM